MATPPDARLRVLEAAVRKSLSQQEVLLDVIKSQPQSATKEIDAYQGRRIFYMLTDRVNFTISQLGLRGDPLSFLVSQDGPFVMTHFPLVLWKPNTPTTATNFGQWSAISSFPLPTQQNTDADRIDLSYEFFDGGSQRNFQNAAAPPVFSTIANLIPLPMWTLFRENASLNFFPTYEDILFDATAAVPTTGGELVVALPGFRIVKDSY